MRLLLAAAVVAALFAAVPVAWAGPIEPPVVETVDCTEGQAVVSVDLREGFHVLISDGEGFVVRIDGPFDSTLSIPTGSYEWALFGTDDTGQDHKKGSGSFVTEECPPVETTTTTAPVETTTTQRDPDPDPTLATTTTLPPIESTTTTTVVGSTVPVETTTSTVPAVPGSTLPFTGPADVAERAGLILSLSALIGFGIVAVLFGRPPKGRHVRS